MSRNKAYRVSHEPEFPQDWTDLIRIETACALDIEDESLNPIQAWAIVCATINYKRLEERFPQYRKHNRTVYVRVVRQIIRGVR